MKVRPTIIDVVSGYKRFLEVKYPTHYTRHCARYKTDPGSCHAEAAIFSILRSQFQDVIIGEDISSGGADFLCSSNETSLLVEVSSLEPGAVSRKSSWENELVPGVSVGSFHMITAMLRSKAVRKADQVSNHAGPRLLIISTEHIASTILLGTLAAEFLLTSNTAIQVPVGGSEENIRITTDLRDSVFFRLKNGTLETCRRSISAIILSSISKHSCYLVGLLHPDPAEPFQTNLFPNIPFIRLKSWPPENSVIQTEWIIDQPKSFEAFYVNIELRDDELRSP